MNKFEIVYKDDVTKKVLDLLQENAVLEELERAFPYLDGEYYYKRKVQVINRIEQLQSELNRSEVYFTPEVAPKVQFLVTRG
jgi:hypothetical protein